MDLKNFLSELKRRRVYKVALTYMAVSWLLLQIADLLLDTLHAPEWAMQIILIVIVLCFPIALILAWAYELSPDGMIRTNSEEAGSNPFKGSLKKPLTSNAIIFFLFVIILLMFGYNMYDSNAVEDSDLDKTIAVLPFDDMSPDKDKGYFSDGMMEEILNHLHKIGDLKVCSKTSSMKYKDDQSKTIKEIAEELGVAHVLEGSVRIHNDQVRITVQLIKANSDEHLFAQNYDRQFDDIFAIQTEVAQKVASSLKARITNEEEDIISSKPTNNLDAYMLVLKSNRLSRVEPKENLKAIELLEQAIELDPNYSTAYSLLSTRVGLGATFFSGVEALSPDEAWKISKPYVKKAIELDKNNGAAHRKMAWSLLWYEWDFENAEISYEETKRIFPNYSWTDFLLATGRFDEAYKASLTNMEADSPNSLSVTGVISSSYFAGKEAATYIDEVLRTPVIRDDLLVRLEAGRIYTYLKMSEKALFVLNGIMDDFPYVSSPRLLAMKALCHYHLDAQEEVNEHIDLLKDMQQKSPGGSPSFYLAMIYATMGDLEEAFEALDRSYEDHEVEMYWLMVEPPFEILRDDPRYLSLVQKVGFPNVAE